MPRFYDENRHGLPERWIQMIRDTVAGLGPKVLASRMVRDYVTNLYAPAAASMHALEAVEPGGAEGLARWKRKVRDAWPGSRSTTSSRSTAISSRWAPGSTSALWSGSAS